MIATMENRLAVALRHGELRAWVEQVDVPMGDGTEIVRGTSVMSPPPSVKHAFVLRGLTMQPEAQLPESMVSLRVISIAAPRGKPEPHGRGHAARLWSSLDHARARHCLTGNTHQPPTVRQPVAHAESGGART